MFLPVELFSMYIQQRILYIYHRECIHIFQHSDIYLVRKKITMEQVTE